MKKILFEQLWKNVLILLGINFLEEAVSRTGPNKRFDLLYIITKNFRGVRDSCRWENLLSIWKFYPELHFRSYTQFHYYVFRNWQEFSIYELNSSLKNLRHRQTIYFINSWYFLGCFCLFLNFFFCFKV